MVMEEKERGSLIYLSNSSQLDYLFYLQFIPKISTHKIQTWQFWEIPDQYTSGEGLDQIDS